MAFNGSGVFVRLYNWVADRNAAIKIRADRMDGEMDGFATGLSNCITKDGQTTVTADLPMNNKKITGLADATAGTDALNRQTGDARYEQSVSIAATVASNALTISLKTIIGTDPSATDPVVIPFRSTTAATGTITRRMISAATSLVISSGSTLGVTTNNAAFRLWVVMFDDAGTLRLGVVNARSDGATKFVAPLYPQSLGNATAEGGAGEADSPGVFYAGAAITNKPYVVLASLDWDSGLATVGTWSTAPTVITPYVAGQPLPGQTIQNIYVNAAAGSSNGTTTYATPTGGSIVFALSRPQNAVKFTASASGFVAATATAVNPNLTATLFRNAVDLACTRTLGLSTGAGGFDINFSSAVAMQAIDFPLSASAQTYSYQHKTTAAGINVSSTNLSLIVEEICA